MFWSLGISLSKQSETTYSKWSFTNNYVKGKILIYIQSFNLSPLQIIQLIFFLEVAQPQLLLDLFNSIAREKIL